MRNKRFLILGKSAGTDYSLTETFPWLRISHGNFETLEISPIFHSWWQVHSE